MNRAPFVVGATVVGLGALLTYHTHPLSPSSVSTAAPATTQPGTAAPTAPSPSASSKTTEPASGPVTVKGDDVQYRYGDIEVAVTVRSKRITNVGIVENNATDPHSAEINDQAVPILEQETLSAQSAHIDGVSGATFTSQAYLQSLQSALDRAPG